METNNANNAARPADKIKVKSITLNAASGLPTFKDDYAGSVVRSFKAFDALVRSVLDELAAERGPDSTIDCYEKVRFIIEWADGETFDGTLNPKPSERNNPALLAPHVIAFLEYIAESCPEQKADALGFLDTYAIG